MAPKSCMLIGAWVGNWIWLRFVHLGILLFLKLFWMPGEGLVSLEFRDGVEIDFSENVDENDGDGDDDTVGNCQLPKGWKPKRAEELDCVEDLNLGCVSKVQHAMNSKLEAREKQ